MRIEEALHELEENGVETLSTKFYNLGSTSTKHCDVMLSRGLLVVMSECSDDEIACEVYVDGFDLWWPKNFSEILKNGIYDPHDRCHTSVLRLKFLLAIINRMIT